MAQLIASYDRSWTNYPIVSSLFKDRPIVLAEYIVRRDRIKSERRRTVTFARSGHVNEAPIHASSLQLTPRRRCPSDKGLCAHALTHTMHAIVSFECRHTRAITIVDRREDADATAYYSPPFLRRSSRRSAAMLDARISRNCVHATALIHPLRKSRNASRHLLRISIRRVAYKYLRKFFEKDFQNQSFNLISAFLFSFSFISPRRQIKIKNAIKLLCYRNV